MQMDTRLAVAVAVAVVLLTILIFRFLSKKLSKKKSFLLVGLTNAGKSLMAIQLTANRFLMTVTSMNSTEHLMKLANKTISLVDLPGFERIRDKFWEENRQQAKGIIFVIDSVDFMATVRDVADLLYNVLVDDYVRSKKVPVLIVCNKQDEVTAKSSKVIESQLRREMLAIRGSRLGALDSTSEEAKRTVLGRSDSEFSFNDLDVAVEFVECSLKSSSNNGSDLKAIKDWMVKVA